MWVTLHFFMIPFFPRDKAGPRGPCTLHTECDKSLALPSPCNPPLLRQRSRPVEARLSLLSRATLFHL